MPNPMGNAISPVTRSDEPTTRAVCVRSRLASAAETAGSTEIVSAVIIEEGRL